MAVCPGRVSRTLREFTPWWAKRAVCEGWVGTSMLCVCKEGAQTARMCCEQVEGDYMRRRVFRCVAANINQACRRGAPRHVAVMSYQVARCRKEVRRVATCTAVHKQTCVNRWKGVGCTNTHSTLLRKGVLTGAGHVQGAREEGRPGEKNWVTGETRCHGTVSPHRGRRMVPWGQEEVQLSQRMAAQFMRAEASGSVPRDRLLAARSEMFARHGRASLTALRTAKPPQRRQKINGRPSAVIPTNSE